MLYTSKDECRAHLLTLPTMMNSSAETLLHQFAHYKRIGENAMAQVKEEQRLFWTFYNDSNSIGILVQHLSANMLHHFSSFYEGERPLDVRHRENEFHPFLSGRSELLHHWEKGWTCVMQVLEALNDEKLNMQVQTLQGERTVHQVLGQHLAHYSYHVGQIVFLSKMLAIDHWDSLSIPRLRPGDASPGGIPRIHPQ